MTSLPTSLVIAVLTCLPLSLTAQEVAGTLKSLRGEAQLERAGTRRAARLGEPLHTQDRVLTGADGYVGIGLHDQSSLAIGPNSDVNLSQYRFNATTHQGEQRVGVRSGSLAAISGKVAKGNPQAVQFNTGTVTLGVRGTQFVMEVWPDPTGHEASHWTDSAQRVIRSGDGQCWQSAGASATSRSDCQPNRYVLLPDRDGSVGALVLQHSTPATVSPSAVAAMPDTVTIDQAHTGVEVGSRQMQTITLTPEQVRARYQTVLDSLPPSPRRFVVRFAPGKSDLLTADSETVLKEARVTLTRWPVAPDVDVVGHTDTTGAADRNDTLSRERALAVARWLDAPDLPPERLHISGRGERQLLVPTPDETDEPRNRRVEITVY